MNERFVTNRGDFVLCYLISEPEEKKLKWTDLKIGDIIQHGEMSCMITDVVNNDTTSYHVRFNGNWHTDYQLEDWKKVE